MASFKVDLALSPRASSLQFHEPASADHPLSTHQEMQATSRPLTHRPSMSSSSISGNNLIHRQTHSRNNSHSVTTGSLNANHRVTRRKSMTITGANVAAVAVAAGLKEVGDRVMPLPVAISARRNTISRNGVSRSALSGSLPSPPASLPTQKFAPADGTVNMQDSAIDDELNDMSGDEGDLQNARVRRASDGQPLVKEGRKSNRPELRCEKCGKGYKHSSCLTKHLWEHTPEWSYTSKLLISKHQQVQLLEAASVLVAMNDRPDDANTPPDSTRDSNSEQDSASPEASGGYLDEQDASSADTTPPPPSEGAIAFGSSYRSFAKRQSNGNGFSRSYQSAPFSSSLGGGISNGLGGHFRQLSQDVRPTSSGKNATGQEDQDLAAAVELLSCSFGSNAGSRTVHLPADAPPVPPLPRQYLDEAFTGTSFINSYPSGAPESFTRGELRRHTREDVKMEESGDSVMDDDDDDMRSRARSDEDEDGVFGRMEE